MEAIDDSVIDQEQQGTPDAILDEVQAAMDEAAIAEQQEAEQAAMEAERQRLEEIAIADGDFYCKLVDRGVKFVEAAADFGKRAARAIAGQGDEDVDWMEEGGTSLRSTMADAADIRDPVSVYQRVMNMMLPNLCPEDLEARVKPLRQDVAFDAKLQEYRCKEIMDDCKFESVDRQTLLQAAMTGYGVRVVMPSTGVMRLLANTDVDEGSPCVWAVNVANGDYACDPKADSPEEERFRAVRFRVSSRLLVREGLMDAQQVQVLDKVHDDVDDDLVYLWLVVAYERTKIRYGFLAKPGENTWIVPLEEWRDDRPSGPIHVYQLRPMRVDNRPYSFLHEMRELHKAFGRLMQETIRCGINEKTVLNSNAEPAEVDELSKKPHMGIINIAGTVTPINLGGIKSSQLPLAQSINDQINNSSANLQQSSGNKGVSDTATESNNLQANASILIADLASAAARARNEVLTLLMHYDYTSMQAGAEGMTVNMPVTTIYGTEFMTIQRLPEDRDGDFYDMSFEICTSKAKNMDPAVRLKLFLELLPIVRQEVMAVSAIGGNPDEVLNIAADLSGEDGFAKIFPLPFSQIMMQAQAQAAMMNQQQPPGAGGGGVGGGGGPTSGLGNNPNSQLANKRVQSPVMTPGMAAPGAGVAA